MIATFIVIGFVAVVFAAALVAAEIVDRRRSIEIVRDASRLVPRIVLPPVLVPELPLSP